MKINLTFFVITFFFISCISAQVQPKDHIQFDGSIEDFFIHQNYLYAAGSQGKLFCIDINSKKILKSIELPLIEDFMGDEVPPKIQCIDFDPETGAIILVSQGRRGYRNIFLIEDWKLNQVVKDLESKWMVSEARIAGNGQIVISLISNEIILFEYKSRKVIYKKQIGFSTLSDISLNNDKTQVAIADESGTISLFDIQKGEVIKLLKSEHVDKVNKVCFSNNNVSGAGQDRRLSFYNGLSGAGWHIDSGFLIYTLGMDREGKFVVYNADESSVLTLYNKASRQNIATLEGHESIVTKVFFNGNEIITSGEDGKICWWDLGKFID
jgi:WD40 repeat protein